MGVMYQIDWHQPRSLQGLPIEQQPDEMRDFQFKHNKKFKAK